ncbi:hypothetical protein DICVIV_05640 [Dictyocaulus viviparus]|uniref:Insulin-like domain-containing protein n=1 Tax=Dictyocaulus viviparus TaxID=29172 RepID=A0A0D8XUJ7_DICVI|nr:hypothetical protein DICVIV_05640 [Dictyocaulus viviparus]
MTASVSTEFEAFLRAIDVEEHSYSDGRLRLCPPGGSSFTMAWSMACTMRKKRFFVQQYQNEKRALVAPSTRQLQAICCYVGCSVNDLMSYC